MLLQRDPPSMLALPGDGYVVLFRPDAPCPKGEHQIGPAVLPIAFPPPLWSLIFESQAPPRPL